MSKDLDLMNRPRAGSDLVKLLEVALTDSTCCVDLDKLQASMNNTLDSLRAFQRFWALQNRLPGYVELKWIPITSSTMHHTMRIEAFLVDGHEFQTLDDVETAINNKAFL